MTSRETSNQYVHHKISKGVAGYILRLIDDYLWNRKIKFQTNEFITEGNESKVGNALRSNSSMIFTKVYSPDNSEEDNCNYGEFFDNNLKLEVAVNETKRKLILSSLGVATIPKRKMLVFRNRRLRHLIIK